jgi:hypothetical protein
MYRRLTTIAILAAAVAVVVATPAAASRSCGTVRGETVRGGIIPAARVTILRGRVSCAQARTAAKDYKVGPSTHHGPANGPSSEQHITLPGRWRCTLISGEVASCSRGGSSLNPREVIVFSFLPD